MAKPTNSLSLTASLLSFALLVAACGGGDRSSTPPNPPVELERELAKIRALKLAVAAEAGPFAVVPRGLYGVRTGEVHLVGPDLQLLRFDSTALPASCGSTPCARADFVEVLRPSAPNLSFEIVWTRSFQARGSTGIDVLDVLTTELFGREARAQKIVARISVVDAVVERLREPRRTIADYEQRLRDAGMLARGQMCVESTVQARVRVAVAVFDDRNAELEFDAEAVVDEINTNARGQFVETETSSTGSVLIQESGQNRTVFAVTLAPLAADVVDQDDVQSQLAGFAAAGAAAAVEVVRDPHTGLPAARLHIERDGSIRPAAWSLTVVNVDARGRALIDDLTLRIGPKTRLLSEFTYTLELSSRPLRGGEVRDLGVIGRSNLALEDATFDVLGSVGLR